MLWSQLRPMAQPVNPNQSATNAVAKSRLTQTTASAATRNTHQKTAYDLPIGARIARRA